MKYLCLVYVEESILHALPNHERVALSEEAMAYCDRLQKIGQLLAASPLHPVETATTVRVREGKASTTDGPFAETRELVAGYWLWEVKDMDEAVEWVKRCPNPMFGPSEIEIRPLYDLEDFADLVSPEEMEREKRLRAEAAHRT